MEKYCYLNGRIIPEKGAAISIHDIGLLRGYALFESLRVYSGIPFLLKEHFERLKKSSKILEIKLPVSFDELSKIAIKLLKKNRLSETALKIVLTGGESTGGFHYDYDTPTLIIFFEKLHDWEEIYKKGVKLATSEYLRPFAEVKSTNYLEAINRSQSMVKEQAFEILYLNDGKILESQTGNFFIFIGDKLVTPKKNVLFGVTRDFILKIAKDKFIIEERDIDIEELKDATECFITGSCKEIVPVIKIDDKKIGNGKVGKNTKLIMELYRDSIRRSAEAKY